MFLAPNAACSQGGNFTPLFVEVTVGRIGAAWFRVTVNPCHYFEKALPPQRRPAKQRYRQAFDSYRETNEFGTHVQLTAIGIRQPRLWDQGAV